MDQRSRQTKKGSVVLAQCFLNPLALGDLPFQFRIGFRKPRGSFPEPRFRFAPGLSQQLVGTSGSDVVFAVRTDRDPFNDGRFVLALFYL